MARIASFLLGGAAGAAAVYFLDPQEGTRRRHVARDKTLSYARRGEAEAERKAHYAQGVAKGAAHRDTTEPGELDDVTLARKVETQIFRPDDAPKGTVDVNVEDGIVYLRGEASAEQIESLVESATHVAGVRGVKNLLHKPGESPPAKEDAPVESA
jgi:osmotically-inducible protein OsmY